jgi:hypothetical protein
VELINGVRSRVLANPPQIMLNNEGAEAVLNLFSLSLDRSDRTAPLSKADQLAIQRLWDNQIAKGKSRGTWSWFNHELDPVDTKFSDFYGATLVERALASYPFDPPDRLVAMRDFLKREAPRQPLHNRLAWIAFRTDPDVKTRDAIVAQLWSKQSSDGGWTTAAIGPWMNHRDAPPDRGSNAYATAWSAYAARESGIPCSNPNLKRALDWLEQKQDPPTGSWPSPSMNKVYPEGSIQKGFMTDAATGFAVAALAACNR